MEEIVEEILLRIPPDEPAHLVRAALVCKAWRRTLRYDLGRHRLSVVDPPPGVFGHIVMEVEDGVLGFIAESDNCIYKWLRQDTANGTGGWE